MYLRRAQCAESEKRAVNIFQFPACPLRSKPAENKLVYSGSAKQECSVRKAKQNEIKEMSSHGLLPVLGFVPA
jgi:hypothetical protein